MKRAKRLLATTLLFASTASRFGASANKADPMARVVEMLDALSDKLAADGDKEEKAYRAYFEWCDESAHQKMFEIKSSVTQKERLESTISKAASDAEASTAKIDDLASKIKLDSEEMKRATGILETERAEFEEAQAELLSAGDTLNRAIHVLEREMAENPAVFAQAAASPRLNGLASALSAVLDSASLLAEEDKARLLQLAESSQEDDADDAAGAPAPDAYKSHSGSIVDTLEELKEKAETQLKAIRKTEATNKHQGAKLLQAFQDQSAADQKALADERAFLADTSQTRAMAEKELVLLRKALEDTRAALAAVQKGCMRTASDHEISTKAREKEMKVIAEAREQLEGSTAGAVEATYSFVQVGATTARSTRQEERGRGVVRLLRKLAKEQHSAALAQLASRADSVAQFGGSAAGPFAKIKGLISDMIRQLQTEAKREAEEKAFCDEETSKTEAKRDQLQDYKSKLLASLDSEAARSAERKKQVRELQEGLASLAKERVGIIKVRAEESESFKQVKADLEQGIRAVQKAITLLRRHYGNNDQDEDGSLLQQAQPAMPPPHEPSSGPGSSILAALEVVMSDMARTLAAVETENSNAQEAYEKRIQEIDVSTAMKGKDVVYKTQEFKAADREVDRLSEARGAAEEELSAVLEYYKKVRERCVGKAPSYEHRAARRKAEMDGLQEALDALEEGAEAPPAEFVQVRSRHRSRLRGETVGQDG